MGLILSGCEVDYYEQPEENQGSGSSLFEDGVTVPSGFDWATIQSVNVTVSVDDQYSGNYYYIVELFDANPLFDEEANLLGKGVAKLNIDFSTSVSLPKAIERIYVQQTDPTGKQAVKVINISGATAGVHFGNISSSLSSRSATQANTTSITDNTRAVTSDYDIPTREYPTPANAIDITDGTFNGTLSSGQSYKIPAGKTYNGNINFAWGDGAYLYVEGIWNTTSSVALNHSKLIIQDGGEFTPGDNVSISGNNFKIVVASAGKFNKENKIVDIQGVNTPSQIINNGLFNVRNISRILELYNYNEMGITADLTASTSGVKFVNEKTLTVGGKVTLSTSNKLLNYDTMNIGSLDVNTNGVIIDSKRLIVGTITMNGSGNTLTNSCQVIADAITISSGISINISSGALLRANTVSIANSFINLESHGILEVNQELKFTNSNSSINGPSSGEKALARLKKVTVENWTRPSYGGYLEVECADHSPNAGTTPYTEGVNVTFVRDGSNSTLTIPATECNDGGNNNTSPGTPTNPTFPIIYEGSDITYLFEDGWPYLGDYDMNDLVLDVAPTYSTNADNRVTQLQLDITVRAVGATKRLAVGLQLDGITSGTISNVTRTNTAGINGGVFTQSNGLESGQTYAVIPVFDDAHEALGHSSAVITNTVTGSENNGTPRQVTFTINFNNPLDQTNISVDKFNIFIINGGYKTQRQEIHLAGFQATDKADNSKFGFADDNSTVKPYTSKNNLIWGLAIPAPAKYPVEWTSIRIAYSGLESWATSGGTDSKNWYNNPDENKVYNE